MKTLSFIALIAAAVPAMAAAADLKTGDYKSAKKDAIPGNVWGVFSYADAQKEAAKKKRALAFLITDERADDPSVKKAGVKAFWAIEEDAITIVLHNSTQAEWKRLPENVQKSIGSADLGKGFPKLVVFNEDASVALAGMASTKIIELSDKDFIKFGKEIKKLNPSKTAAKDFPPPSPDAAPPAAPAPAAKPGAPVTAPPAPAVAGPVTIKDAKAESWTNAEGKVIQAALLEVNGDDITFQINGKPVPYSLSKLSAASQKRVEELKASSK